MVRKARLVLAAVLSIAGLAAPAAGQNPITVDRIFAGDEFRTRGLSVQWAPGGSQLVVIEPAGAGVGVGSDVWLEDLADGTRVRLVEGQALASSDTGQAPAISSLQWSPDRTRLLLLTDAQRVWRQATRGSYLVHEPESGRTLPVSAAGPQMFARFSPDASRVGFVRENDLWITDTVTGEERRLTGDGSEVVVNGTSDWVYEEELGLRDAWRWSPDGRRIAFWRFDQAPVETFYMVDETDVYSRPIPLRYPKAGTANSLVRIGVIDLETDRTIWIDTGDEDGYLARMDFAGAATEVAIQRLNRAQNRLDLLIADVTTGESRIILTETAPSWVEVTDDLRWIGDGEQFLWTSERDGFRHIYLYGRDGELVRQITQGAWEVLEIEGVDANEEWVYFTAINPTPSERQLFRARLTDGRLQRLSTEPGSHSVRMSPDASTYIDSYSRGGVPPVHRLHRADGTLLRVLEDNADVAGRLAESGATPPAPFSFITADGVRLNGWMIRPPHFDPAGRYPALIYAYGGPGSQSVTDAWGGTRYLWHQALAAQGYIVVSVDNRGTGGRGRDFKNLVFRDLGRWETHDQIEAARYLATLPYVQRDRIGIWGWSYGGYLAAMALMQGADHFRAGISVAPVTDWRLYDTIYTERYMRTPAENPEGYARSAPLNHVEGLESRFLLVHGTGDDNVHSQNSMLLAQRLQEAGKHFDFMLYPNQTHSISAGTAQLHLFTLLTQWLEEHL